MAQMRAPGPDHPMSCTHPPTRARALFNGHLLADSARTLVLNEAENPVRVYFPRQDVEMSMLTKNDHVTYCPYKGKASWFTLNRDRRVVENVAWSYEEPYPAMDDIAGMISFDLDLVDIQSDIPGAEVSKEQAMADYIRHTDSGSGGSQETPWAPNVSRYDEVEDEEDDARLP